MIEEDEVREPAEGPAGASPGPNGLEALAFLAKASETLAASLDHDATLATIADLAVPKLGDLCLIDVLDDLGEPRRVAATHARPEKEALARDLLRFPPDLASDSMIARALRTGQPLSASEMDGQLIGTAARSLEHRRALEALQPRSAMVLPLVARGRALGAITLVVTESERTYGPDDLRLAVQLADRCALAIDNARLFRDLQEVIRQDRESHALLDTVFDTAPVGLALVGPDLRIKRINAALAGMDGESSEHHIGRSPSELLGELGTRIESIVDQVVRTGEPVLDVETHARSASRPGQLRHWVASAYPVDGPEGGAVGVGVIVRETTARRRIEDRLATQYEVARNMAEAKGFEQAVPEIVRTICQNLGWDAGAVWIVDRHDPVMRCIGVWHDPAYALDRFAAMTRRLTLARGIGLPGRVWESGQPAWIPDVLQDPNFPRAALAATVGLRAAFGIPIRSGDRILGVLEFFSSEVRELDDELLAGLAGAGNQIGQFMERTLAEAELADLFPAERQARQEAMAAVARLEALRSISDGALIHLSLDDLLNELVLRVRYALSADTATILLLGEDGRTLTVRASTGREGEPVSELRIPVGRGLAGRIAAERAPVVLDDISDHEVISAGLRTTIRSLVGVPLIADDRLIGVLHVGSREGGRFSTDDVGLLELTANRAALALENARLYAAEQAAKSDAQDAASRMTRLQSVTAALAATLTLDEVAGVVVRHATTELGAASAILKMVQGDGTLQTIASRGSPEELVAAFAQTSIESPLPMSAAIRQGEPLLLTSYDEVVERFPALAASRSMMPPGAMACVPIEVHGQPLAGLIFNFTDPRPFSDDDRAFLEALAQQCAQAFDRARLYEAERRARTEAELNQLRLTFLGEASIIMAGSLDFPAAIERLAHLAVTFMTDLCLVDVLHEDGSIHRMAAVHADPAKEPLARQLKERYAPDGDGRHPSITAMRTGRPEFSAEMSDEFLRTTTRDEDHYRLVKELGFESYIVVPLKAGDTTLGALTLVSTDPDRRYGPADVALAEELARRAAVAADNARLYDELAHQYARERAEGRRRRFLAAVSEALSGSLNVQRTLTKLARLAVRGVPSEGEQIGGPADWCSIDLVDDEGAIQLVAVEHRDPGKIELAKELRSRFPIDPRQEIGVANVLRTGRPELIPEIPDELLTSLIEDPELLGMVRTLGLRSSMIVPLTARGRTFGAMTLVAAESGRRYDESDLGAAMDLAHRAAIALDNARLYHERSFVARTLQNSLLPPDLPEIPGVEIAARYRPAGEGAEIGGDFYDAFEIDPRTWGLAIGDVCGKGTEAAALTGLARHTIRAAAIRDPRPSRVLRILNEATLRHDTGGRFLTAAFGRLETAPATERGSSATLTVACGGHPMPLILRADGTIHAIGVPGTLLGVFPDPELSDVEVVMGPADAVVFFTDGVIEERSGQRVFGLDGLRKRLTECQGMTASEIAASVEQAVMGFGADQPVRDDVAILVARVAP